MECVQTRSGALRILQSREAEIQAGPEELIALLRRDNYRGPGSRCFASRQTHHSSRSINDSSSAIIGFVSRAKYTRQRYGFSGGVHGERIGLFARLRRTHQVGKQA